MAKKVLAFAVVAFLVYYVLMSPDTAAHGFQSITSWTASTVQSVADGFKNFFDGLLS